ncbi:MAG: hypothetical protein F6K32_15875 [Desertifilum sp. SIO1I2]|nr:hypothetical protein [Desertifilum sp. SIO1I2]
MTGGIFIVFLTPDAGENYPAQYPCLPDSNTVEGYRRTFGYLDYLWSVDGHSFDRDSGQLVEMPSELIKQCRFVLYPYVASEFYWSVHQESLTALRHGTAHPERSRLLEWEATEQALEQAEREGCEISEQMRLENIASNFHTALQIQEVARIEQHLHQLYQWHGGLPQ